MSALSAAQSVSNVGAATTYGGAATSATIVVSAKYQEGGFLYWVDSNALVISIGIAFTGLIIQFASSVFVWILKSRAAKREADSK